MMKGLLKRLVEICFGKVRAHLLVQKFKYRFSESAFILKYFVAHPRNGLMIDVGAHFGESFEFYLDMGWRVIAFEPDPVNQQKINTSNPELKLFSYAVSDTEQKDQSFYSSKESSGISTLTPFRKSHTEITKVQVTTLRKILNEEAIDHVDFLKIDTEGNDLLVLKGFPWERLKPEIILCELEDSKTIPLGYNYKQMGDFLISKGYKVYLSEWYPIIKYGPGGGHKWRSIREYPCDLTDQKGWGNYIAVSKQTSLGIDFVLAE